MEDVDPLERERMEDGWDEPSGVGPVAIGNWAEFGGRDASGSRRGAYCW